MGVRMRLLTVAVGVTLGLLTPIRPGLTGSIVNAAGAPVGIQIRARSLQPGELIAVKLTVPAGTSGLSVHLFNRTAEAFPIDATRWEALVGIDLDQKPGPYTLTVSGHAADGPLTGHSQVTVLPKVFRTRTLRVAPEYVNPPPELQQRIDRESALIAAAYAGSAHERLWTGPFTRPVPQAANSAFGTRSVFNGQRRTPHAGTDFLSGAGTPIKAPNAGRVVVARDIFFSGNTVIIDHGLGLFSMLAHLSRIDVREGDPVVNGAIVGLVGSTGRVTGPHLHWALRANGARVDALSVLALPGPEPQ